MTKTSRSQSRKTTTDVQARPERASTRLNQKIVLITGAGSGIGRAVALLFANEGALVGVSDLDSDAANETASHILEAGGRVISVCADVSRGKQVERMVRATVREFGGLDILVCSAGVRGPPGSTVNNPLPSEFPMKSTL